MDTKNTKRRGRPEVDSERVCARLPRELLDGIDCFALDEEDKPQRPEALRRIVRDWLIGHRYLPVEVDGEEDARVE